MSEFDKYFDPEYVKKIYSRTREERLSRSLWLLDRIADANRQLGLQDRAREAEDLAKRFRP